MAGTGVAYPADAVTGAPLFTALQGRNALSVMMGGASSARPLGGVTGVRPGTPATTVTATSTTWTAAPFAGYIDLQASNTNSGYAFVFGASTSGAVTAAGGSARTDIVWVQIADSNTGDGSTGAPRVIIDYTANTLTPPARAFVIAQINVPASGGGAPTVTWVAPYTVAAGGILPVPTTIYPASSYNGQYVDDAVYGQMRSNGTTFQRVTTKLSHAEWTTSITGMADGTAFSNMGLTADPTNTTDTGFVTITASALVINQPGIYALHGIGTIGALLTGRAALYFSSGGVILASRSSFSGENILDVTIPNLIVTAAPYTVNYSILKTTGASTGAGSSMTGRVRVTRLSL